MEVSGSPRPQNNTTREQAARNRANALGLRVIKRGGRYRLVELHSKLVPIDPPMTLAQLEREITRLARDHVDGCQCSRQVRLGRKEFDMGFLNIKESEGVEAAISQFEQRRAETIRFMAETQTDDDPSHIQANAATIVKRLKATRRAGQHARELAISYYLSSGPRRSRETEAADFDRRVDPVMADLDNRIAMFEVMASSDDELGHSR